MTLYAYRKIILGLGLLLWLFTTVAYAQSTEICNNGIDDDGDKLIDCQDPDCPECARFIDCVEPNTCYMPPVYGNPTSANASLFGSQDLVLSTNAPFTTVTIRTPDGSYTKTVVVTSTGSTIVSLPTSVVMSISSATIQRNKGLIITSDEPVQATYRLTADLNQDIVPLKCRAALGYSFYAGSQTRLSSTNTALDERHFVSVMATQNNSVVTFRSPITLEGISASAGTPFSVTLNAGDTYMVTTKVINGGANTENKSVSGVLVTSTQPIVVNSGSQHNYQPYSGNRDAGIDQLVPARIVGQTYVAIHGQNTTANSDYVIVVAIENNTSVSMAGPASTGAASSALSTTTLNAGNVFTFNLPNVVNRAYTITASRKVYVYHISSYAANEFGMGILPEINPCNGSKRIDFYRTSSSSNDQALVTIPTAGLSSLIFRGQPYTTFGNVVDNISVSGIAHSVVSFPNTSIATAGNVNTITSNERFHVGVVSNTGGASTGNYGFYSNYEARVDVLNPINGQPDDFYTVAEVTKGVPLRHCLKMTSCGNRNRIINLIGGSQTQAVSFDSDSCITYTMKTSAPICARDTIRVAVENDLGRQGIICLEFVNRDNNLIVDVIPNNPVICRPTGTVSLTVIAVSPQGNYQYQWITPDKQLLTTPIISGTTTGAFFISVTDAAGCRDTATIVVRGDLPSLGFNTTSGLSPTSACPGTTATYSLTGSSGTYFWSVTNGTIVAGGTTNSNTVTVRWPSATSSTTGSVRATITNGNGCTATATQPVTIFAPPTLSVSTQNPACSGSPTGRIDLMVTGNSPFGYQWSNGATSEDLNGITSGTYSVTVNDKNGCMSAQPLTATLSAPTVLAITSAQTNLRCNGAATGSISLSVSGGTPGLPDRPYRYQWSNGGTTQSLSSIQAGSYTVTVSDNNGCTGVHTVTLTQPPALSLTQNWQNPTCHGDDTGVINLTVTGGTGAYSYRWNDGPTTKDRPGLPVGTYSVTITDANSCTTTTTIALSEPTPLTATANTLNASCFGGNDGLITVSVSGGIPGPPDHPYQYRWSDNSSAQSLSGLVAGTYSITITDASNCPRLLSVSVTQPMALSLTRTVQDPTCFNGVNGAIDLTISGGTGMYVYHWNDQETNEDRTGLLSGNYSVTVTDENSCSLVSAILLTEPTAISPSTILTPVTCNSLNNGAIDLTVTGGTTGTADRPYSYTWTTSAGSAFSNSQDVNGLLADEYIVTIRDANGCTINVGTTVLKPPPLSLTALPTDVRCPGLPGTITTEVRGGTPLSADHPYQYLWSNGATTATVYQLPAGSYSLTVTDANKCNRSISTIITVPPTFGLNAVVRPVNCNGSNTGRIDMTVEGGTPGYRYQWSNGATTEDIDNLPAAIYSLTVTDANNCLETVSIQVQEPPLITLTDTHTNVTCFDGRNGAIDLIVSGGTAPFSFEWTDALPGPTITTEDRNEMVSGLYRVIVSDKNGCKATHFVGINEPQGIGLSVLPINIACSNQPTGRIELTAIGGTGLYRYLWSTGATSEDVQALPEGVYSVTVADANNCTADIRIVLTQPEPIEILASQQDIACNGGSNGVINLFLLGGTEPYQYQWNDGSTAQHRTGLSAGTYTVTVTDANNCSQTTSVTLNQPAVLNLTTSITAVSCFGGSNGAIQLTVSGGLPAYNIAWTDGFGMPERTGLSAGTYTVRVTDANQCTALTTLSLSQPAALSLTASIQDVSCFGGSNGAITLTASGGTAPYTATWDDNVTGLSRQNLPRGVYAVVLSDGLGCTKGLTVEVNEPNLVQVSTSVTLVSCSGGTDGGIGVSVSGGTTSPGQPYQYQWSRSDLSGATVNNLTTGAYSVTISDANLCRVVRSVFVSEPPVLTFSVQVSPVSCQGNSNGSANLTPTGGTPPYAYRWSNGAITEAVNNLLAGPYSVTVTDFNQCTETLSFTITEPVTLLLTLTPHPNRCEGDNTGGILLDVTGGNVALPDHPYRFLWSNGQTTQHLDNIAAGTYSVTVLDNNGCLAIEQVTVLEPARLFATSSLTHVSCFNGTNGAIDISISGGTSGSPDRPYRYSWEDGYQIAGATTEDRSNLKAGIYSLTVTDEQSCEVTAILTITEPAILSLTASSTPATCLSTGSVSLSVSGGTTPYTYQWNNGSTSQSLTALPAGTYSLTLTDANLCAALLSTTITQTSALSLTATTTPATCLSTNTGSVSLSVNGGTTPYAYQWNNGSTSQSLTALPAGTYTVRVTDANLCTALLSTTITQTSALSLTASSSPATCLSTNTGSVSLSVSGGTTPYAYQWSNGSTSQSLTALPAGTYSLTLTDANLCAALLSTTITQASAISLTATTTPATCLSTNTGSVSLSVSGGTTPYAYQWSNGSTSQSLTALPAGTYSLTLTDANQCSALLSTTITQTSAISLTATSTPATCLSTNTGSVSLSVSGGTTPYAYQWSNGSTSQSLTALPAGTYSLTLTDANQCSALLSTTITQTSALSLTATTSPATCTNTGSVSLSVSGGATPYAYQWSNGSTSQSLTALPAGTYSLTITDANLCAALLSTTITQASAISLTASSTPATCLSTGSVSLSVSGGTTPYTYQWNNGSTSQSLTALPAGTYSLTLTDANLCAALLSTTITQTSALSLTATTTPATCLSTNTGSVSLSVNGGTTPYAYQWNNGSTSQSLTALPAGTYTVRVTDANLCTALLSTTITQTSAISLTATTSPATCLSTNTGSVSLSVSGGTTPYAFQWNNGSTSQSLTALPAGTYSLTLTDANLCSALLSTTITQTSAISLTATSTPATCLSTNTGSVSLSVSGGTTPYAYQWSNGSTSQSLTALPAGTYSLTLTDANLCSALLSTTILEGIQDSLTLDVRTITCLGALANQDGQLILRGFSATDRFDIVMGSLYSTTIINPGTWPIVPANGILINTLPNPTTAQPYTVRVVNEKGCYTDLTTILTPVSCQCPPETCVPVIIKRAKY